MTRFACVALMVLTGSASAACLPYEPAKVTLTGAVHRVKAFGAPGFGENPRTDAREDYDSLRLDQPICTIGAAGGDDPHSGVKEMQLVFLGSHAAVPLGRPVAISGSLFAQQTGHHHTEVLITVDRMSPR